MPGLFTLAERVAALESWAETVVARLDALEARVGRLETAASDRLGISLAAADALWKDGEATGRERAGRLCMHSSRSPCCRP